MKAEDLVIGKEYYFDAAKVQKGLFFGIRKDTGGLYFESTSEGCFYLKDTNVDSEFFGKIGFIDPDFLTPAEL